MRYYDAGWVKHNHVSDARDIQPTQRLVGKAGLRNLLEESGEVIELVAV